MTALAQHGKATVEHGTPSAIVEAARRVLGVIHVDPFSNAYWNEVVKAEMFYTAEDSALGNERGWDQGLNWFVNPPGGLVKEAWDFALARHREEHAAVFWVGFNLDQFSYLGSRGLHDPRFRRAVPPKRIAFLQRVEGGPPVAAMSPTRNNYLLLMPKDPWQVERFDHEMRELGAVPW